MGRYVALKSLLPGGAIFVAGVLVWLATAGLLFFLALPVIVFGVFLLAFATLTTKYDSPHMRYAAIAITCCAIAFGAVLVWPL